VWLNELGSSALDESLLHFQPFLLMKEFQYTQSGDTLIITHPNLPPTVIQRRESVLWEFDWFNFSVVNNYYTKSAFQPENITAYEIKASATTGAVTLTATVASGVFKPGYVGACLRFEDSGTIGYVLIDNVTDGENATGNVLVPLPAAAAAGSGISQWAFSSFNFEDGFPRACAFYQERLILGSTKKRPDSSFFSEIGNFKNLNALDTTPSGYSPFAFTPSSGEVNHIQWYSISKVLRMGTYGREYILQSNDSSVPGITYENISASGETSWGSLNVQPVRADNSPIFVDRDGYKLREFTFNFQEDNFRSANLTLKAEHLPRLSIGIYEDAIKSSVQELAFHGYFSYIWCLDENGYLFGITRNRQENITAGSRHQLGGSYNGNIPVVKTMCMLPSDLTNFDELWVLVQRTIDGETKYYIETIGIDYLPDDILTDDTFLPKISKPVYMDSCVYRNNTPEDAVVTDLEHLEGETVVVWADGFYVGEFTVTGGEITLPDEAEHILVGLNYRSVGHLLEPEFGSVIGSAIGSPKRVDQVKITFFKTIGAKFGISEDDLEEIEFRPTDLPMNDPIPMFTGMKKVLLRGNYENDETLVLVQDLPLPFTVCSVVQRGVTYD
jgi:hypothetical protein